MSGALTLGPVLFNWAPEVWRDFHFRMADEAPIDAAHIGEVVCLKRAPFLAPHLDTVAERYVRAGKQLVFSSLALVVNNREAEAMRGLVDSGAAMIEANDVSLIPRLTGRPFIVGPTVNVYNEGTLAYMERLGATRVCLPPELPRASLAALSQSARSELEVLAFGRMPLAFSARCFHARAHGLSKDGCRFVCDADADGLGVDTLDGEHFLAINGTQVLSHAWVNLVTEAPDLVDLGIARFRLSPQTADMVAIARGFRAVLDGDLDAVAAAVMFTELAPGVPFANGFYRGDAGHLYLSRLGVGAGMIAG